MARSTVSSRDAAWRRRVSAAMPAPSSRQLDYFLARELFRRAHPVPSLRDLPRLRPRHD